MSLIKENLSRAQPSMKVHEDKHRRDVQFKLGEVKFIENDIGDVCDKQSKKSKLKKMTYEKERESFAREKIEENDSR